MNRLSIGPWLPASVRAKFYRLPFLYRLQISFDEGANQRTMWMANVAGFALAVCVPSWVANRILGREERGRK